MKTFRLIGIALLAIVLCVNFASCSSDDEPSPIVGTWKYSSSDDGNGTFTFKSNGGLVWDHREEITSNNTYTLNGSELKINFNDNDYYTLGTFTINGNNATYKYFWYDSYEFDNKWHTMTLIKQ